MPQTDTGLFTVGVFQDLEWAERGVEGLRRHQFEPSSMAILAKATSETEAFVGRSLGAPGVTLEVRTLGAVVAGGPLVGALQGESGDLVAKGVSGSMRRVGFQPHDGLIFEKLLEKGGVLVAIRSESRAADALAVLHAFGGGNAAIGAWLGRV
jgi:hypothetical protein